ncbi:41173_t:CDS:1, partial [Gigaspora margarita]
QFVQLPAPLSVSITGRTYHRILSANFPNHSIHWYLYNEQEQYYLAHNHEISNE